MTFYCSFTPHKEDNALEVVCFGQNPAELCPFTCIGALQHFGSAVPGRGGQYWESGVLNAVVFMCIILTLM